MYTPYIMYHISYYVFVREFRDVVFEDVVFDNDSYYEV